MGRVTVALGSRSYIKRTFLSYCLKRYSEERIWLVDSLQIFDPYFLSRHYVHEARELLESIRICRPFTFYQLKDKLFSFSRIPLNHNSTIIISSMDYLGKEIENEEEKECVNNLMIGLLKRLQDYNDCNIILGLVDDTLTEKIFEKFQDVRVWEEQLCL